MGRGGAILKAASDVGRQYESLSWGEKESRSGRGHPQGWACDRERRETRELTSNYLLVCCSTLTGLEQHLIGQTGGELGWGRSEITNRSGGKA